MAEKIQVQIDESGRLQLRTSRGLARLAVIDSNGDEVRAGDIEGQIADAMIDAVFAEIAHKPTAKH